MRRRMPSRAVMGLLACTLLLCGCTGYFKGNGPSPDGGAWISPGQADVPLNRRKSARQVVASLMDQLGLSEADFFPSGYSDPSHDLYPVKSPDEVPRAPDHASSSFTTLGGASWLTGRKARPGVTSGFLLELIGRSQAWCRISANKAGSPLFAEAAPTDTTATPEGRARIRSNLAHLYLRMLGAPPEPADVDELFALYQHYESAADPRLGTTAVCAALVRHPLWITY